MCLYVCVCVVCHLAYHPTKDDATIVVANVVTQLGHSFGCCKEEWEKSPKKSLWRNTQVLSELNTIRKGGFLAGFYLNKNKVLKLPA